MQLEGNNERINKQKLSFHKLGRGKKQSGQGCELREASVNVS